MTKPPKVLEERQCLFCGDTFKPNTGKQRYDTLDCRYRAANQKAWEKRQADKAAKATLDAQVEAERRRRMADPAVPFTN